MTACLIVSLLIAVVGVALLVVSDGNTRFGRWLRKTRTVKLYIKKGK